MDTKVTFPWLHGENKCLLSTYVAVNAFTCKPQWFHQHLVSTCVECGEISNDLDEQRFLTLESLQTCKGSTPFYREGKLRLA